MVARLSPLRRVASPVRAVIAALALIALAAPMAHSVPLLQSDYQSYTIGPDPRLVVCGDFDGDGYDDVAVVDADGVLTCHAHGDGTLEAARPFDATGNPIGLVVLDHARGKRARLGIVLRPGGGAAVEVDVYDRVGFPHASAPVVVTFDRASDEITVADLDGDGVPDLLAADGDDARVSVAYGRKNGEFEVPVHYDAGMGMGQALAGDVDGDGRVDIMTLNAGSFLIGILPNRGDREFGPANRIYTYRGFGRAIAGDFDGDGRCDLGLEGVLATGETGVRTWYGTRDGSLVERGGAVLQKGDAKLVTADLNRDGRTDVIAAIGPDVLLGGRGSLGPAARVAWGTVRVEDLAVGDFDGDGVPDLAVVDGVPDLFCFSSGDRIPGVSLHVWHGVGDGTFESVPSYAAPQSFAQPILADLDGDGLLDLVVGSDGGAANGVTSWRGRVDGTFDSPVGIAFGGRVLAIAAANFDGGAGPELAVTLAVPGYLQGKLALVKLGPDRASEARVDTWVGANPQRMAVADVNGDGRPDLVLSNRGDRTVSVLLAGATFGAWSQSTITSGRPQFAIAAADLDGDGIADLALGGDQQIFGARSVRLYRGLGGGAFAFADSVALPQFPRSIRCLDVDGDGRPDLVLTLSTGICPFDRDVVRILPNLGELRFGSPVDYTMDEGPQDATLADLTGDGIPDLVATTAEGRVSVRPGLGGFRFGDLLRFGVAKGSSTTVLSADLNHDGRTDVVVNDRDSVYLLMNRGGAPRHTRPVTTRATATNSSRSSGVGTGPRFAAVANPVPAGAELAFDLDLPSPDSGAQVALYDVAGRRIGLLARGPMGAGHNRLAWSTVTGATRPAPGLYFARAALQSGVLTARVLVLP